MMTPTTRNSRIIAVLIAIVALAATSCSTTRHAATGTTAAPAIAAASPVAAIVASYNAAEPIHDFYAPFSIKIKKPASLSMSGRATMIAGQSIKLSMRMLGIEVALAYVNNDSTWLVDKFHKMMCVVPTERLTGSSGLRISDLQSIMLGRMFYPGLPSGKITDDLFVAVAAAPDSTLLRPRKATKKADWYMLVDATPAMAGVGISLPSGHGVSVSYSDSFTSVCGAIARKLTAEGQMGRVGVDASITWDTGKMRINTGITDDWTPPSGYQRLTPAELIEMLKKMR